MTLDDVQSKAFVEAPSVGAVTYQARVLITELKGINEEEYPHEACRIRNVLLCLAEYILGQLWDLYDSTDPMGVRGGISGLSRVRGLARIQRELYSYLRYLRASSSRQSPPAIQLMLRPLIQTFFPSEKNGEPVCVVRPQWRYNLRYVPLTYELRQVISRAVLDPEGTLEVGSGEDIIQALWRRWVERLEIEEQKQVGIDAPPATCNTFICRVGHK